MAEPPLKKQKLTRDWFLEQLQGLELDEDLKKSVAEFLGNFPESSLRRASLDALMTLLGQKISDKTKRAVVSLQLHQCFQSEFAPAPVPRTQSLFCSFHPIKCFFGVGRLFVEIGGLIFSSCFGIQEYISHP